MRPASLPLVFALVLAGCSRGPAFREVRLQPSAGTTTVRGDGRPVAPEVLSRARAERVVVEAAASTPWWQSRDALVTVATEMSAAKSVTLEEGEHRLEVRLPQGAQGTRGDAWVVDVGAAGAVRFGIESTNLDAFEDVAAKAAATPSTWFLVRGDDASTFGDVMTALVALERLAPGRVVLGVLTAAMTPTETWICPSPKGKQGDEASVSLVLSVREDGKVGYAHVIAATDPEFAVAAVFCVARQRLVGRAGKRDYKLRVNFAAGG